MNKGDKMKCPKCDFGACPKEKPLAPEDKKKIYRCNRCDTLMDKNGKELSFEESYWYNLGRK